MTAIVALLALAATFVPAIGAGRSLPTVRLAPVAAVVLIVTVVMSALWNRYPQPAEAAPTATTSPAAVESTDAATGTPAVGTDPAPAEQPPAAAAAAVTIAEFAFDPAEMSVAVGSSITWTNADNVEHTVDSGDGSFVSEDMGNGAAFEHTFDTAGSFAYICGIHPSMKGTVTVTG